MENAIKAKQAFHQLRRISIRDMSEVKDNAGMRNVADTLRTLCLFAPSLETLLVKEIGEHPMLIEVEHLKFPELIDSWVSFNLQYLELHGLDATHSQLVAFFRIRASTLIEVGFNFIECTDKNWTTVLDSLRTFSWPKLRWFAMTYCHDAQSRKEDQEEIDDFAVQEYLRQETDRNPRQKPYVYRYGDEDGSEEIGEEEGGWEEENS